MYTALYGQCRAGAQINFPESGRGLGHVTTRIFGSTVGYPSDSLASCWYLQSRLNCGIGVICKDSRNLGENFEHAGVCSCNLGRNKIIVVKFGLNNEVYYSDATARADTAKFMNMRIA